MDALLGTFLSLLVFSLKARLEFPEVTLRGICRCSEAIYPTSLFIHSIKMFSDLGFIIKKSNLGPVSSITIILSPVKTKAIVPELGGKNLGGRNAQARAGSPPPAEKG